MSGALMGGVTWGMMVRAERRRARPRWPMFTPSGRWGREGGGEERIYLAAKGRRQKKHH